MGRRSYSAEFRRKVLDRIAQGHSLASVAHDLELSDQTIYNWRPVHASTSATGGSSSSGSGFTSTTLQPLVV